MGKQSGVQWCTASHGFWYGCRKVSEGCRHCYAERDMIRYGRDFNRVQRSKSFDKPLTWKEPERIFVNPWSDFFLEDQQKPVHISVSDWRKEAWEVIGKTPQHTYLILTKRPERIKDCLPDDWGGGYSNVWLGVSVENQKMADWRIPLLLDIPAVVHFLSVEPMLGFIDLSEWIPNGYKGDGQKSGIGWVICGGESGPNSRPLERTQVSVLQDQCWVADIPFFFKQWGGNTKIDGHWGGNELDGQTYQQLPDVPVYKPPEQMELF